MKNVTLTMKDLKGNETIRTIDSINAMTSGSECWELRGQNEQRKRLELWISERGNEQHNTKLVLVSWTFSFKSGIFQ